MADTEPTKICARCHIEKPHSAYYLRGDRNAPRSACIECHRIERAGQGRANADRALAWREADRERARESGRASYARHVIQRRAEKHARWCSDAEYRQRSKSRVAEYRRSNPEENNNRQARARRAARAEEYRQWFREYHLRNPERRKIYEATRASHPEARKRWQSHRAGCPGTSRHPARPVCHLRHQTARWWRTRPHHSAGARRLERPAQSSMGLLALQSPQASD